MATEQDRARLTVERGKQAARMPHGEAKRYVESTKEVDRDFPSTADASTITQKKLDARDVLGSYKRGGRVKKTGVYKLHRGERVVPARSKKRGARR